MREWLQVVIEAHRVATWRERAMDAIGAITIAATIWLLCQIPGK